MVFEELEVFWIALSVDHGLEDVDGFRGAILASLQPAIDDGPHIDELVGKVTSMSEADAVHLMAQVGQMVAANPWLRQENDAPPCGEFLAGNTPSLGC
ncbi:MAG: hypothetical protein ACYDAG_16025 [Chloroflexota bacterium]